MYIKYSFFLFVLFNLSMITASEPVKISPICNIDLFSVKQLIVDAQITRHSRFDSRTFILQDGSDIQHIDFLSEDAREWLDSYTLLIRYKNKQYGVVDSTQVLHLSAEQLKKLRSSYSQLYPVE